MSNVARKTCCRVHVICVHMQHALQPDTYVIAHASGFSFFAVGFSDLIKVHFSHGFLTKWKSISFGCAEFVCLAACSRGTSWTSVMWGSRPPSSWRCSRQFLRFAGFGACKGPVGQTPHFPFQPVYSLLVLDLSYFWGCKPPKADAKRKARVLENRYGKNLLVR